MTVNEFQLSHPQYRTAEPATVVAAKLRMGQSVSDDDRAKVLAIVGMVKDTFEYGVGIEDVFASRKVEGRIIPEQSNAQPSIPGRPGLKINPQSLAAKIAAYKTRMKNAPPSLGGGAAGGQRGRDERPASRQMIEEDKKILGQPIDDFASDGVYK